MEHPDSGTLFSLTDELSTDRQAFWRVRADVRLAPKHVLSALAAPQGRAEDILAALQISLNRHASLRVGYRLLEGGADVSEVYTFTLLHYLSLGATVRF